MESANFLYKDIPDSIYAQTLAKRDEIIDWKCNFPSQLQSAVAPAYIK